MQPYIAANCHCIGKSHVQNGMSCEDYSLVYTDASLCFIAVSDGHGDKNCVRSGVGARLACEVSLTLCRKLAACMPSLDTPDDLPKWEPEITALEQRMADTWRDGVQEHAARHPLTQEELAAVSEQARALYEAGQSLEHAYGCTLLTVMLLPTGWIALQIGDGACVAAYEDGIFVQPIPADDEHCVGNHTASLCDREAAALFRHHCSTVKPLAAFVMSDGVTDSFDQAGLYHFLYSAACWLRQDGADALLDRLEKLMPQISEGGSADDVSLSVLASQEGELLPPRETLEQVYQKVNAFHAALTHYRTELCHAQERRQELADQQTEREADMAALQAQMTQKRQEQEACAAEQQQLAQSITDLTRKLAAVDAKAQEADRYRTAAEDYWHTVQQKLGLRNS